ncbi:ankyrin repeat domain-containing protein [Maribacter litopenaei]|uniref:Ankyrin repeat domain-containing protein n=1 Tax=Maribacter litopenaei TaxID=2976127 RepID=A0ABY5Y819_9FLAO|nr:ankyrin repeat domain-containing protein [Maribacter litopenaei]UWX54404.1 ankyrin repeat domain-containing protein [Maribacter litopenaei]
MIQQLKEYLKDRNTIEAFRLISDNPEILDIEDENKSSGFMMIAYSGQDDLFQKAIELKKSFSFHEAIIADKASEVQNYLEQHPDNLINEHSKDGFSPLALAAFFNKMEIATLLLQYGADPNLAATNASKVNALHAAVAKENYELCQTLIEKGANVNLAQMQNVTPLHSAVHRGNLTLVQLLIENGASPSVKMENGDTPHGIAEREGHHRILEYFNNNT